MAKFKTKTFFVQAEQFLPNEGKWPDGVIAWSDGYCPRDGCFGFLPHNGSRTQVTAGSWIVTYPDGKKVSLTDKQFRAVYEPYDSVVD